MKRRLFLVAVAAVAAVVMVTAVSAEKPSRDTILVDCGSDGSFNVVQHGDGGNSSFSPVHISGSNRVLIPVAFSNVHGSFTDETGTHPFEDEDTSRGTPANADLMDCHFSFSASDGIFSFSVEGDVVAYIPGN